MPTESDPATTTEPDTAPTPPEAAREQHERRKRLTDIMDGIFSRHADAFRRLAE